MWGWKNSQGCKDLVIEAEVSELKAMLAASPKTDRQTDIVGFMR